VSKKLLIIGARKKSIGHAVKAMWADIYGDSAITAGISGEEQHTFYPEEEFQTQELLGEIQPDRVLVTIGMNEPIENFSDYMTWMEHHMHANVAIPMSILSEWFNVGVPDGAHFVVLSSNSAHIPRSQSQAYCASKAALSMAVRCAARDVGKMKIPMSVYGWEPGLVKGTPMTGNRGGTRMLGLPRGMSRRAVATPIVHALAWGGPEYNGVLNRLDAGEV
jgi:NAD(P)-dependent dehydrogenase (short-subunit alcohol dehydrogenase family)